MRQPLEFEKSYVASKVGALLQTIKVGVIGCGVIAESNHLPAFRSAPGVRISAIADIDKNRLADISKKFDVKKCYTDYHELLQKEDEIDAVSICLPTYMHKNAVITAAEAHKHILCEKPLACTLDGARQMIRVTEKNDVDLYVGFCLRFAKVYELLRKHIHNDFIGVPMKALAFLTIPFPRKKWYFDRDKGGGVLFDTGSHMVDLLTWIFGEAKVTDAHFIKNEDAPDVDVESVLGIIFEAGLRTDLTVTWQNPIIRKRAHMVRVEGSNGTLSADLFESTLFIHKHKSIMGRSTKGVKLIVDQGLPVYWKEIWEFVDNLRMKDPSSPLATGEEGLKCLELVLSAYKPQFHPK